MKFKDLLTNKTLLYVLTFLAVVHILGYLSMNDMQSVVLILAIGSLTYFFSKNMIVILFCAIFFTNLLNASKIGGRYLTLPYVEGMRNKKEGMMHKKKNKIEAMSDKVDVKMTQDAAAIPGVMGMQNKNKKAGFVSKTTKKKEGMKKKNDDEVEVDDEEFVDHAKTLEKAYDNMERILGSEGMQKMTDETKHLIKQQKDLASNLKGMTPIVKEAMSLLDGFSGSKTEFKGFSEFAKALKK